MKKIIYIDSYKPNSHAQMCSKHRAVSKQSSVTDLISCVFQGKHFRCAGTHKERDPGITHISKNQSHQSLKTQSTAKPASPLLSDDFHELVALYRQNSASSSE